MYKLFIFTMGGRPEDDSLFTYKTGGTADP